MKAAIFDLDGTLLDSMYIWDAIGDDYLISRGISPEKGLREKLRSMSLIQAAQYYRSTYGLTDSPQEIVDGVNSMICHMYTDVVKLKDGARELLQNFSARGIKMCVATGSDRCLTEAALSRHGLLNYFSQILTCSELGFGKDSPEIFEEALKLLGADKAETYVFEDSLYAIQTAKKHGFKVVGIFDPSSKHNWEEIRELSDYSLHSIKDWSLDY